MTGTAHVSNAVLKQELFRVSERLESIAQDVAAIKQLLHEMEGRVRTLETDEAQRHPVIQTTLESMDRRLTDSEERLKTLENIVIRLDHSNRVMAWFGGVLGSTVIIWLITQILQGI